MQIVVNGLMTRYQQYGSSGKVVLLIHGWGDRLETFQSILGYLEGYKVICLDLPGFGDTQMPNEQWDLNNYAQFLNDFLRKLNINELYAVVGHSNGGALAIKAIAIGQLKPDKLVLLAASGVRDGSSLKRASIKAVAKTGKVATFWLPKSTKQKLQKKLYGTVGSDMLVAPHMQETFKLTVRQDIQADAEKITIPTLLIYGEDDKATPVKQIGERLHRKIANSEIVILPGGHFIHQDDPAEVGTKLERFLS